MNYTCEKHGWVIGIEKVDDVDIPIKQIIMPCGCEIVMNWWKTEIEA